VRNAGTFPRIAPPGRYTMRLRILAGGGERAESELACVDVSFVVSCPWQAGGRGVDNPWLLDDAEALE
jgi:hypothetical protein